MKGCYHYHYTTICQYLFWYLSEAGGRADFPKLRLTQPQVELELELSFARKEEEAWCEAFLFETSPSQPIMVVIRRRIDYIYTEV